MTEATNREFGTRVRRVRERMGMSQTAFAASLGIAKGGLSMIESGKRRPSIDFLVALEQVFGIAPEEITHGIEADPFVHHEEKGDRREDQRITIKTALMVAFAERTIRAADIVNLISDARPLSSDQLKAMAELRDAFVHGRLEADTFLAFIDKELGTGKKPTREAAPSGAQRDVLSRIERGFAENWLDWVALSRFVHEAESRAPTAATSYTPPKIAVRAAEIAAEEAAKHGAGRLEQRLSRRKTGLVPLVRIAAGMAIEALDATETGDYVTPPPWLEEEKIDAALRVVGDSMTEEGLRHDDIVFVRRKAWHSGGIAVARRRSTNEITLKQVFSRGAELELRSASERAIAPMRWPADDSELHGVEVVGMWRPSWHGDDSHSQ